MSRLTIAIICGGPSSEHEVSCVSGGGVLKGLDKKSFAPILIGITKAGKWVALDENYSLSIKTLESYKSASLIAADNFSADLTLCVPRLEPPLDGFTKAG